jgi:hypothetical protein
MEEFSIVLQNFEIFFYFQLKNSFKSDPCAHYAILSALMISSTKIIPSYVCFSSVPFADDIVSAVLDGLNLATVGNFCCFLI